MNAIETKSWERYEMYTSVAFVNNEWWKQQTNEYWNMNDGKNCKVYRYWKITHVLNDDDAKMRINEYVSIHWFILKLIEKVYYSISNE